MVFVHELYHFRFHDNPIILFTTIVTCLFWYNPLIWTVRRMLREYIEVLCDSRTIDEVGIQASEYAIMLCRHSEFAEICHRGGCNMTESGRRLKYRLQKNLSAHLYHQNYAVSP